jgi:hypothetical protein
VLVLESKGEWCGRECVRVSDVGVSMKWYQCSYEAWGYMRTGVVCGLALYEGWLL